MSNILLVMIVESNFPLEIKDFDTSTENLLANADTAWRWATTPDKKSMSIEVDKDFLTVTRNARSHNPSVFTTMPLTKERPHFRVQVKKLGNFVGIGLAGI